MKKEYEIKIFNELKKLGYKHYTKHTIEELDNLPLNSEERIMEQALVLRWFRKNYFIYSSIIQLRGWINYYKIIKWNPSCDATTLYDSNQYDTFEEAELECIKKLIEITQNTNK
jgi:hypothetical protein